MNRSLKASLERCAAAVLTAGACAAPSIEFLPPGFLITDLSFDGTIACGNVQGDGSYETFRWTSAGGPVRLGRATVPVIGGGSGSPDVSFDGRRISASILSADQKETIGIWDATTGWAEAIPPLPANGTIIDNSYASAWGLSGDGRHATGFYWKLGGGTQGCTWSPQGGVVALSQVGRSVRVNAANADGSVVAGWESREDFMWQPTVWRNGVRMRVDDGPVGAQCRGISGDGSVAVGDSFNPAIATRVAAVWHWDGAAYQIQRLPLLPGTPLTLGFAYLEAVSNDGSMALGSNLYSNSPGGPRDGIVWTPAGGTVKDTDFIASLGLSGSIPATMNVVELNAISPDGSTIAGIGLNTNFSYQTFVIRLRPACPGDTNADSVVGFADLNIVLSQYGQTSLPGSLAGDLDHDGDVDFADLNVVLSAFGTAC